MKQFFKFLLSLVAVTTVMQTQAQFSPSGQVNFFAPSIISACNRDTFFLEFTNKNGPVVPGASDIVNWEITSPAPAIIKFENTMGTYTAGAAVNFISNTAGVLKFSAQAPTLGSKIKIWFLTNTTCPVTTLNLPQLTIKTTYPASFNPNTTETYQSSMMNPGIGQLTWTNPNASLIQGFKFQSNQNFQLRNSGLGRISSIKYTAIIHDSLLGWLTAGATPADPKDHMYITGPNVPAGSVSLYGPSFADYTIARYDALHRIVSWTIKGAQIDAVDGYLDPGDFLSINENYLRFPNTCQPDMDKRTWFTYECVGSPAPCDATPDTMDRVYKITAGTPIIAGTAASIQTWDGCPNKTGSFSFKNNGIKDPTRIEVSTAFDVDLTLNFGGLLTVNSLTLPAGITTTPATFPATVNAVKLNIKDILTTDPDGAGKGLEDIDGDGFYDDLLPGDSIPVSFVWSVPAIASGSQLDYNIRTSSLFTDYCKKLNGTGSTSMYQFGFRQTTAISQKTPVPNFGNLGIRDTVTKQFDYTYKFAQTNINLSTAIMKLRINYDKNNMIVEPIRFLGKNLTLADFTAVGAGDVTPVSPTGAGYADSTNNTTDVDSALEYTFTASDITTFFDANLDSLSFGITRMSCRPFQNTTAKNNWEILFQNSSTNCPTTGVPPAQVDLAGKRGMGFNIVESCTPGRPCYLGNDTISRIAAVGFTDETQTVSVISSAAGTTKFYLGDTLEFSQNYILNSPHPNMEPIGTTPYTNNWYYGFKQDLVFSWSKTPGELLDETNSAFIWAGGSRVICIDTTTGSTIFDVPLDKSDFHAWNGYDGPVHGVLNNLNDPGQKILGDNLTTGYEVSYINTNAAPGTGLGDAWCTGAGSANRIDPAYCPYADMRAWSPGSPLYFAMQNDAKNRISEHYALLWERALVRAGVNMPAPGQTKYKWIVKTRWVVNPAYKKHTNLNDFRMSSHMDRYGNAASVGTNMPATSYTGGCAVRSSFGSVITKDIEVDGARSDYSTACGLTVRNALNFNNSSGNYIPNEVRVPFKMDSFVVTLPAEYHTTAVPTLTAASSSRADGTGTATSIIYSGGTASAGGFTGKIKFISTGMPYTDFPRFNDSNGNTTPWVVTYSISNTGTDNSITQTYKVPVTYYLRDEWDRPVVKIDTFTISEATPFITVTPLGGPIIMNDGGSCQPGYMDVLVANNTLYGAANVWIAAESTSSSTLVSVEDVGTYADPIVAADVTTYGANNRFIKIGGMGPAEQRVVRLKFSTTVCSDNVKIISNFGCNFPATNMPTYPSNTIDSVYIAYNAPAPTIMSAPINGNKRLTQLCDTAWLEVDLRNADNSNMYGIRAGWKLPSTVRYVVGSAQIAYPIATYAAANAVTVVGTDSLSINIMNDADFTSCGLKGADEENTIVTPLKPNQVRFKIAVTFNVCPTQGIDPVFYRVTGANYCGLSSASNGVFNFIYSSMPGAPNVYDIASASSAPIRVCNGANAPIAIKDTILVRNVSGPPSVNTDTMELLVAVDTSRMSLTTPVTAIAPWVIASSFVNPQGRTVYKFAMQTIASGASMPLILNYTVQPKAADVCASNTTGAADLIKSASFFASLKVECVSKGLTCPSLGKESKGGGFAGKSFSCCVLPNPKIDTNITPEDMPVSGNVLTNDTYPPGSTVSIVKQPTNGTMTLNPTTGAYTYTPNLNFNGLDTAKYRICDTNTPTPNCKDTLIIIRVTPVNDPPVLTTTPRTTPMGTPINICNNFTDVDGTPAYTSYSCQGKNGSTSAYSTPGNQSCATYTPNTGFYGVDSFCMIVCDAAGLCDTVMQYVTVTLVCPTFANNTLTAPAPICAGATPSPIVGSTPTATPTVAFKYKWFRSTTSATAGFTALTAADTLKDYAPGMLTDTVWYRRLVYTDTCKADTARVMIAVNEDCDGDGVLYSKEITDGTDPNNPCDYLVASQNYAATSTAFRNGDCDGDGVTNGKEIDPDGNGTAGPNATDPRNPCSFTLANATVTPTNAWNTADCDGDGVTNLKELNDGTNPLDTCDYVAISQIYANTSAGFKAGDCDKDGVTNGKEIDPDGNGTAGPSATDPKDPCSLTVANQTLPSPAWDTLDCDGDGITNAVEKASGTNPSDPCSFKITDVTTASIAKMTTAAKALDCDGDGVTNIKEIDPNGDGTLGPNATDPTDPCKYTLADRTVPVTAAWNLLDCDMDGNPNGTDPNPLKPVAKDDSTTANVGVPKTISILGNDDFLPNDGNTITRNGGTAVGTVAFDPVTGNMTYTASASEAGKTVTVEYIVCQGLVCDTALVTIVVPPITLTNPDVNSTFVNTLITGSVKTNDSFVTGTTYGAAIPILGNPGSAVPSMNPDGTYNFTSAVPGVFYFNVPVCPPNVTMNCPMELLTITVLDPNKKDNIPVANTDITSTKEGVAVTLNTLANDKSGNDLTKLVPSTVTVTDAPNKGTASVNPLTGNITYTPNPGFTGKDTLKYRVCDNAMPANCTEAYQIITVLPTTAPNKTVAADDYISGPSTAPTSGNALTNDSDPEGNTFTATPQTTTIAGKGTLVLNADGSFVFTPVAGYNGPVSFPYTKCDNGAPIACAMATIYVVVNDPTNTDPDVNATNINVPVTGNLNTNDDVKPGTTYGVATPIPGNPGPETPTINPNGTYTFTSPVPGVYQFEVPVCPPGVTVDCPKELLTITVLDPNKKDNAPVATTDNAITKEGTPVKIASLSNDKPGDPLKKLDPASVTVTDAPSNGTTAVDPLTGDITYTPNTGFTGLDTLKYNVCDNSIPAKCTEAIQIITVLPSTYPNTTEAADDYISGPSNSPTSGNALTNDTDPEGNTFTATPQTTTVPGKGTLVLNADGSFVFTPVAGYNGPVEFAYEKCDNGMPKACAMATIHVLVNDPTNTDPDVNVTYTNVPVTGNLKTNDDVKPGTSYGTPTPVPGNPGPETPTINPDGTYTFTSPTPGVYQFEVPVCPPGMTVDCPKELLTITVLDPNKKDNPPVANTDNVTTKESTPVKLSTLSNDKPGDPTKKLDPASVVVTDAPSNGTTMVDPVTGDITFTPNPGFTGIDTLKYKVCDNSNPALCTEALQIITVLPSTYPNTTEAADDYVAGPAFGPIPGNALKNDTDPEGHGATITPQTTTLPGKGTLVLNADGSFVFTPDPSYDGPVEFPYEKCDSGMPKACAMATIHVLVEPAKKTNPDINSTWTNTPVAGDLNTNDKVKPGTKYGSPTAKPGNPGPELPTIDSTGKYTFTSATPGVYQFEVPVCPPGVSTNCPTELLTITVKDPANKNNLPEVNTDIASTKEGTPVTLVSLANDKPGDPSKKLDPSTVTVTELPKNGIATVDPATGNITYTPNPGFTGVDTLKYKVCDSVVPTNCAEAYQIITVLPTNYPNTTVASDDYYEGSSNGPISGNAKTNDSDPEGHTISVTPQTTTLPGKGTIVLKADGSFVFTPVAGFEGPVEFPYESCDNGTPVACTKATIHILVKEYKKTNPDVNTTWVNTPVTGNLNTNDIVKPGTTYGAPSPILGNPGPETPMINPDGTYTFTSPTPGVYQFNVPVCPPGVTVNCPTELLTITVLDPGGNSNVPVANTDIATTKLNTPVKLKTLSNDNAGNEFSSLVPSTVTITVQPKNGTATVDPVTGDITYTPNPGFDGIDTLKYKVCDNAVPTPKCAEAYQIITVLPANSNNVTVAADDYNSGSSSKPMTGNVMTNDTDPEGNKQNVTPQTTTVPGKGTLVLNADGSYVFTPVAGYNGPVDFPYTICDDATAQACAKATLHILVKDDLILNPDVNATFVDVPVTGNLKTNDVVPNGTTYGSPTPLPGNPSSSVPTINPDGTYTFTTSVPGVYQFNVPVCPPGVTVNCPTSLLTITVLHPDSVKSAPIANTDLGTTKQGIPITLNTLSNDKSIGIGMKLVPSSVAIVSQPMNGTAVVDPVTGNITYTPKPGFVGKDTLTYMVCDDAKPPKCATALQIITVLPSNAPNVTSTSDDYNSGPEGTQQTGNVLTNDFDVEGNKQTVTPQSTTIPGKGTLVLNADGSYVFTPVTGFTGPVEFVYTMCDDGLPAACANATLHILVEPSKVIDIPNYFSPNGDGVNDVWNLDGLLERYPNARAIIYNRWGNIVWRSTGPYGRSTTGVNNWFGQLEGSQDLVPDGVYYYLLEIEDEFKTTKTGFIEIMRQ